ncbi:MAG TPA: hypothetical protein VLP43_10720 [Solirubrobacteraceae bacterium]|nr:hypothetical protein [Solirubrobacteraceae bacterium]
MRLRFATLGCALGAAVLLAVPGVAGAAPTHNHGMTINATPNPIPAGQGVLIYGRLNTAHNAGRTVVLYHHINGTHTSFSVIGHTTTDPTGYYSFTRGAGVVETNRQWFTRLAGHPAVHSRTVSERVAALVRIAAAATNGTTRHALTFTGHVTPNHAGNRVVLQEQTGGDDWTNIASKRLGPGSNYSISHAWRTPGAHVVRVTLPSDLRNLAGHSDTVDVTIQQTENPSFTINAASSRIGFGSTDTITGTLFAKGASTTPERNTPIALCPGRSAATECIAGSTGTDGNYLFTVSPDRNGWYQVRTVLAPKRRTANLFIGVQDTISLTAAGPNTVGQKDTFSGTVVPPAGQFVLLQRKGEDGDWHDVSVGRVHADGSYSISHKFGTAGTKVFRTRVLGDGITEGAASAPVPLSVAPAPIATLAPAS